MFRLIDGIEPNFIRIELDGAGVEVPADITLAAALLYLDAAPFRETDITQSPRAAYCMTGSCFDCLVQVDTVRNQRACQIMVWPDMRVNRQLLVSR